MIRRKALLALGAAVAALALVGLTALPAAATDDVSAGPTGSGSVPASQPTETCTPGSEPCAIELACPSIGAPGDWYVNHDEWDVTDADNQGDRRPTSTPDGFTFEGTQLVHHATDLSVADLNPGSYIANPAPGPTLTSFFSVEVAKDPANGDFSGYATLRWDANHGGPGIGAWNIGGKDLWNVDPNVLVTDNGKGTRVFSFGVGYVNTPDDGTMTTVSEISFNGHDYNLTCPPPVTTTQVSLPKTGLPEHLPIIVLGGIIMVLGGAALVITLARSRQVEDETDTVE